MSMEHDQDATNRAATSAKLREAIRKAHSTPQPVLPALLLRKGDVSGHEFRGNQYGAAAAEAERATTYANSRGFKDDDHGRAHEHAARTHNKAAVLTNVSALGSEHVRLAAQHKSDAMNGYKVKAGSGPTGRRYKDAPVKNEVPKSPKAPAPRPMGYSMKAESVTLLTKARDANTQVGQEANTQVGQEAMRKALRQAMTKPAFAPLYIKHSAFAKDADT